MQQNTFGLFLGAGASCELGMPLVSTLTKDFKQLFSATVLGELESGWKRQDLGSRGHVLEEAMQLVEDSDLNYENILGNLQTQSKRVGNKYSSEYHGLYITLLDVLYRKLYEYQIKAGDNLQSGLNMFTGLKNFAQQSKILWTFSLNHDIIFELLAAHCGLQLKDGFWQEETIEIPINGTTYSLYADVLSESDLDKGNLNLFYSSEESGVNLLKLHGALDVFAFSDRLDQCRLRPLADNAFGMLSALILANQHVYYMHGGQKVRVTNEIPFTDVKGELQFLRKTLLSGAQKYNPRYSQTLPQKMLGLFRSYLNYVVHLYVVGYSFGDSHVDSIIREWLEFSKKRQLSIVGPEPLIPNHFKHLKPQVSLVKKKASEFFKSYE